MSKQTSKKGSTIKKSPNNKIFSFIRAAWPWSKTCVHSFDISMFFSTHIKLGLALSLLPGRNEQAKTKSGQHENYHKKVEMRKEMEKITHKIVQRENVLLK